MDIGVIVAHPGTESFNQAVSRAAAETLRDGGHRVSYHRPPQ